jgi:hypothetical protein
MLLFSLLIGLLKLLDPANAKCDCINLTEITNLNCYDLSSWSELNKELSSAACFDSMPNSINFMPSQPILLTNKLKISQITRYNLKVYGLSGLSLYPWPFCSNCTKVRLVISISRLDFYVNNKSSSEFACSPDIIPDDSSKGVSLISSFINLVELDFGNTYGSSSSQLICPYLFKNADLSDIYLSNQVDSFLFVSLFRFQQVNFTKTSLINSNIDILFVTGYNYKLDSGILSLLVFEKVTSISCKGVIGSMLTDLFKQFQLLDNVIFQLTSLGDFYHKIGITCWEHMDK